MSQLPWHDPLPRDVLDGWIQFFKMYPSIPEIYHLRSVVPLCAEPNQPVRLICVADAAEEAIGAAIYAGFKLPDGSYTCTLLISKSRVH